MFRMPPKTQIAKNVVRDLESWNQGQRGNTSTGSSLNDSPKTPARIGIDGIPFSAFPSESACIRYYEHYWNRTVVVERQFIFDGFNDTTVPNLIEELGWMPFVSITGTACAQLVRMFYSNILEVDADQCLLRTSMFGREILVTPAVVAEALDLPLIDAPIPSKITVSPELLERISFDLWGENRIPLNSYVPTADFLHPAWLLGMLVMFNIYPSSQHAEIKFRGCVLLSRIIHQEPINLPASIVSEMIIMANLLESRRDVLPYGILVTRLCQRNGIDIPAQATILPQIQPLDVSSWNRHMEQFQGTIRGPKIQKRERIEAKEDEKIEINSTADCNNTVPNIKDGILEKILARFNNLEAKIADHNNFIGGQISSLDDGIETGFSLVADRFKNLQERVQALEDIVHNQFP